MTGFYNKMHRWAEMGYLKSMFHFKSMLSGILHHMGITEIKWKISLKLVNIKQIPLLSFYFILLCFEGEKRFKFIIVDRMQSFIL